MLMMAALLMIFAFAPEEQAMGIIQKIFYFHVPIAWVSFLAFFVIFISSIAYLVRGRTVCDNLAYSSAEIGLIFNTLMLVTGSIWAKAVWNTWWAWDPRLTTSLILWFIYAGYLLVRNFGFERERSARFAAVIGIIGFADVPVVALSIVLWRTQHPSALVFEGGLTPSMLITLIVSVTAFTLFYVALLATSLSIRRMEDTVNELEASDNHRERTSEIR